MSFEPRRFPEGRRTSAREEKLIAGYRGNFETQRALGFGRRVLRPGSYSVRVRVEKIELENGKSDKEWTLEFSRGSAAAKPQKTGARAGRRGKKSKLEPDAKGQAVGDQVVLAAPLRLKPRASKDEEPSESLSCELALHSAGKKLGLTFRAGRLVATAHLRVVETAPAKSLDGEKLEARPERKRRSRAAASPKTKTRGADRAKREKKAASAKTGRRRSPGSRSDEGS